MTHNKILVVAAHPDDEVLGCGGTMARLAMEGNEICTLILGEGITSRDAKRDAAKRKTEIACLKEQIKMANKILKVKKIFSFDYPDNRFDTIPLLDIIKTIEDTKGKVDTDIVFTHHHGDLNIDHQITYKAVLTASRPLATETVKNIYSFEVLSSTEWMYPLSFSPDIFFGISKTIDLKMRAMEQYKTELFANIHPRSL